ncbi:MAG: hypothetical protein ACQEP1_02125 [Nanobdellota archaeon]
MVAKKGDGAGGAAALVGLIALAIILYILFLPANVREDLLEEDIEGPSEDQVDYKELNEVEVMRKRPGRLDINDIKECMSNECSHEISSFTLYRSTDSNTIKEENPFIIKNNIMKEKTHEMTFEIPDPENTKDVRLGFISNKNEGILTIELNGNIIYEKDIEEYNPNPIELPGEMLSEANTLKFSVSSVGARFWKTNEYSLENVRVIGDITDLSKQDSKNTFFVSGSEANNVERAKLKFSPNCEQSRVGKLQIKLNSRELYYGIPDCQMLNVIDFPPTYVEQGENELLFKTDKGDYLIDLIEVRTDLKDIDYPVYYFDLKDNYEEIVNGELSANVSFEFVTNDDYDLIMNVNGYKRQIRSEDEEYSRIIPADHLKEEDNWMKLKPDGQRIEVAEMVLRLVPEYDADDYRYFCEDGNKIYVKNEGKVEDTSWRCKCEGSRIYGESKSEDTVKEALCE